jgi:ABC-2 type transport system ATP-binding protein
MSDILCIKNLSKSYAGGVNALSDINLNVKKGEIFALLGPNGAGKTTLISIICGIARASAGTVSVNGHDHVKDYRLARELIGLVPQETALDSFETVLRTCRLSRGLFGKHKDDALIEDILDKLSLLDKRDSIMFQLSGGMKRRVMIAKALSHEPKILFLDEPTAGVDVELRKDMWQLVLALKEQGVTIILTTHYIEEAEAMADRVGVISKGRLALVEEKESLLSRLGKKTLKIELQQPVTALPPALAPFNLEVTDGGSAVLYTYDKNASRTGITTLLSDLSASGLILKDLQTQQTSLEDIFIDMIQKDKT